MEERYRLSFENIMDVVYMIDTELNVLDISPSVERILGYKQQEFIGRSVSSLSSIIAPESFSQAIDDADRILKGENIPTSLYRFIARDGTPKIGEVSGSPVRREGKVIGMISVARDVTGQKQTEEALRESEERFRAIADYTYDWENWFGPDGKLIWVNSAVLRFTGYSVTECLAMSDFPIPMIDETDLEKFKYHFSLAVGQASGNDVEFRIRCKDGSLKWMTASYQPIYDSKGNNIGHRSSVRDITDRKRTEEALRESEERYRNVFENHTAVKFIIDPDTGRILEANNAAVKYYGWPQEQLVRMKIQEINTLPPEDVQKEMNKTIEKKRMYFEFRHRRADGSVRDVEVYSSTVDLRGKQYLHSIVHDITERKTAEEALRESEEVFRLLFEKSTDGHLLMEGDRYIDCNEAAMKIAGLSDKAMLIDRTPAEISPERQPDGELSSVKAKRMIEIAVREGTHRFEWVRRQADGSERYLDVTLTLLPMKGRKLLHATWRDMTEHIQSLRERERLQSQLIQSQKMEAIGNLAGGIAHDFNNILAGIMGYTEFYMDEVQDRPKVYQGMEQVLRAAERAKDLVQQVLTFSRKTEHAKKPVVLAHIVDEVVRFMRASIPTTIEIKPQIGARSDVIIGDPSQLHQVLVNLCTNAGHAMKDKGGILGIELNKAFVDNGSLLQPPPIKHGRYLVLTVRDTGHGISRENLERIFEPYFTTKEKGEGTGLGLAVVHGIVKNHGGEIRVYSEEGRGTEFKVYLPFMEHTIEEKHDRDDTVLPGQGETILFVDDEQMIVELNKDILENLGYRVVTETDPIKAIEVFKDGCDAFDLVITDKTMPHLTGFDVAQAVRDIRADIPVLLCSGFQEKGDAERIADIGISKLIIKPTSKSILARTIRDILDRGNSQTDTEHSF
jgi:PAS domain S-box-containing protein